MERFLIGIGRIVAIAEFLYVAFSYARPLWGEYRNGVLLRDLGHLDRTIAYAALSLYCGVTALMLALPKPPARRLAPMSRRLLVCCFIVLPLLAWAPSWTGWSVSAPRQLSEAGYWLMTAGALGALAGTLAMGRSFGLVPARRELVRRGVHAVVRHPIYSCHALIMTGFLLIFYSPWILGVTSVSMAGLIVTALWEERLLSEADGQYAQYCRTVRWRFIPWVL
jgi:protein-S-isoprenylcysteine O-methyltransferase Ste14